MEISDKLLCLFTARVEERDGSVVVTIPKRETRIGDIEPGETYSFAILKPPGKNTDEDVSPPPTQREREVPEPPVEPGETRDVEIEDIGEQGDGIARVERGYVIIVPDTEEGERVNVEITEVRENVAFARVVERYDIH